MIIYGSQAKLTSADVYVSYDNQSKSDKRKISLKNAIASSSAVPEFSRVNFKFKSD